MSFNSLTYAAFFPTVLALYWLVRRRTPQNVVLLIASYAFYAAWDYRFLVLMWTSTLTDYAVGRAMAATNDERRRRRLLVVSLVVNLGILGFFKYFNFFDHSTVAFFGHIGVHLDEPTLRILLPVGISFYTFHGISYTVDVYRRVVEPTDELLTFAVFVAFFPQLVAGPIGRAEIQLPQFEHPREVPSRSDVSSALALILLGLFKKVAIADALAPFVNSTFAHAHTASAVSLVLGAYAFALQIYGDFSGYSDIARGSARLLGVELLVNFEQPYLSRTITEFWQRWHISLSSWLRDYLYIPLGGNRGTRWSTYRNLLLTMVIGGLWHGAAWTFVVWGTLHGVFLVAHRAVVGRRAAHAATHQDLVLGRDLVRIFATFNLVCFAWIFFRASTFSEAFAYLKGIITLRGGSVDQSFVVLFVLGAIFMFGVDVLQRRGATHTPMLQWNPAWQGAAYGLAVVFIVIFSGTKPVPFIYFRF